ncbi:MAG: FAD-dependent oxidoreductase [Flavobacteriales bacterium]|nr:FAD-dependent oxidoreductase [Flavobacteriales bacterium]
MQTKLLYVILAAIILFSCGSDKAETTVPHYDVIVVGAGASGMYAAYHLNESGVKVKVLEANATHGGRAQYDRGFSGGFVEVGPEEIYSSPDYPTPVREQALGWMKDEAVTDGYDIDSIEIKGDSVFFAREYWDLLPDSGQFTVDLYRDLHLWDSTLLHEFRGNLENKNIVYMVNGKRFNAEDDDQYQIARDALAEIYEYEGPDITYTDILKLNGVDSGSVTWSLIESFYGAGLYATSLNRIYSNQGAGDWEYGGDKTYYVDLPYKDFLDTLYFHELHDAKLITYNSPVTKIDYSADTIIVTDKNGEDYTANQVVVTVSVEVLKSEVIEFVPALPKEKVTAYNGMAMDIGWRMYLKFNEPIWDKDDIGEIFNAGYSSRCWAPTRYRREGATDENVLVCYVMGERAEYLMQPDVNEEEVVLSELDAVFGGTTATDNFISSFSVKYGDNPYIGGIYTYPTKGMYPAEGLSIREVLAQPVEDKLFFGGEATNNAHNSTVFGALETGLRCAEEVISVNAK